MSIVEIIGEISKNMSDKLGRKMNYLFGDTEYVRNILAIYSKSPRTSSLKFPLLVLFTSFSEQRGSNREIESQATISMMIAVNTISKYTNEERLETSFIKQLRPIYDVLLDELKKHHLIDIPYNEQIPHYYRERFDLGSRGAMDSNGKMLDDLIDAIEIENLEIKIKKENCYGIRR